jgi:hypothetical protein
MQIHHHVKIIIRENAGNSFRLGKAIVQAENVFVLFHISLHPLLYIAEMHNDIGMNFDN